MIMLIPRIIHQTWKDDAVPARLASFQAAWRRLHPDWTYPFWTDATSRAFVAEHYPDFLAIYDGYREPIMRVDEPRPCISEMDLAFERAGHGVGIFRDNRQKHLRRL